MARDRDVQAFQVRSPRYDRGWRGDLHHRIAERTADITALRAPGVLRILDVGCGTGFLLRRLAEQRPEAIELVGIDAAPGMIAVAQAARPADARLRFTTGVAEDLPFSDESFDLVVSTTSFDHWADQRSGLAECRRVVAPGGHLVITDLFSALLAPTLLVGHRGRARTVPRARALMEAVGWRSVYSQNLSGITVLAGALIRAVSATA